MIDVRDDDKVTDMGLLHGLGREPNTVLVSGMALRHWLLSAAVVVLVGCQAAVPTVPTPTPGVPTPTRAAPTPPAAPTASPVSAASPVSPPPVGSTRVETLNAANTAYRSG